MGRLTDDMTRLCGEINGLRRTREAFIKELKHGVAMTKGAVAEMQASFHNAHADMAKKTKAERVTFIAKLKESVSERKKKVAKMRQKFADEIEGARLAWFGRRA